MANIRYQRMLLIGTLLDFNTQRLSQCGFSTICHHQQAGANAAASLEFQHNATGARFDADHAARASGGGVPDEVPEHRFPVDGDRVFLPKLLTAIGLATSKTEANRLLKQRAVTVDDEKLEPGQLELPAQAGARVLLRVGKRRFARVTFE